MSTTAHSDPPTPPRDLGRENPSLNRVDLAVLGVLVGILLGFFWKVVFTPAMFFYRDVYNYTYPSARYIHDFCRQGVLPYWNPYLNYGQPLLANPNLLFFYPFTIAIILLPIDLAYKLHYLAHFALAGIGAYALARHWGQSRVAAFFAAFVFTFSGPVLSLGNLYNHVACAAWIPWALLAIDHALDSPGLRPWILLTAVFSMQFLAGEPLTLLATFGLTFAYAVYRRGTVRPLWTSSNFRILLHFLFAGCLMIALCSVQFLPAVDFLSHARRGTQGLSYAETTFWSFHPLSLVEVVAPDFFGSLLASPPGWMSLANDRNFPYFRSVFIGFVPLFLGLAGWALGQNRRRSFVALAALGMLLLAFGRFTPAFALTYLLVPLLELVRFPVKLLVPAVLLVAILGGWGLDALRLASSRSASPLPRLPSADPATAGGQDSPSQQWRDDWHGASRRRRVLFPLQVLLAFIVVILAVSFLAPGLMTSLTLRWLLAGGREVTEAQHMADYLVGMIRAYFPGLAGFTLCSILIVVGLGQRKAWARFGLWGFALLGLGQLLQANHEVNPTVPKSYYTYQPPLLAEFQGLPGSYRVSSPLRDYLPGEKADLQSFVNFQSIPEAAGLPEVALGAFRYQLLLATGSMVHKVEGSLNLDLERSIPFYVYDLRIYLNRQAPGPLYADCLLGRTNVKYSIYSQRQDSAATSLIGEVFNGSPQPSYLYENLCFVPRAYLAGTSLFSTDSLDTLRRLASPDFDAKEQVILAAAAGTAPSIQGTGSAGRIKRLEHRPNTVRLVAELSRPGYAVLLERYDPNWHATVDGHEATVLRANQLFRAVYVGPGEHEIRFYYRQRGLIVGLLISLAALASTLTIYFRR
jgi:hypothetical protein